MPSRAPAIAAFAIAILLSVLAVLASCTIDIPPPRPRAVADAEGDDGGAGDAGSLDGSVDGSPDGGPITFHCGTGRACSAGLEDCCYGSGGAQCAGANCACMPKGTCATSYIFECDDIRNCAALIPKTICCWVPAADNPEIAVRSQCVAPGSCVAPRVLACDAVLESSCEGGTICQPLSTFPGVGYCR